MESSPEEFLSANEAISASTSFSQHKDGASPFISKAEEEKVINSEEVPQPEMNGEEVGGENNTVTGVTADRRRTHKIQLCFFHIFCTIIYVLHLRNS